jgi:hypothetical protein
MSAGNIAFLFPVFNLEKYHNRADANTATHMYIATSSPIFHWACTTFVSAHSFSALSSSNAAELAFRTTTRSPFDAQWKPPGDTLL